MDRETLQDMVKLKFAVRRAGGPEIDLVRLAGDAVYADAMFSAAEALPDEALVLLSMTLRDKFGLLAVQPAPPAAPPQPEAESASPEPAARYLLGARS